MMMFRVRVNQSSAILPEHVKTIMASNTSTSTIDTYVNAVEATVQVVGVGGVGAVLGGLTAANAFDFATAGECRAGIRATFIAGAVIGASYTLCKVMQYWHWRSTVSLSVGRWREFQIIHTPMPFTELQGLRLLRKKRYRMPVPASHG